MEWDDFTIELITRRWKEKASASTIAAELGVTKGAVCGKIHRLGLSGKGPKPKPPPIPKRGHRRPRKRSDGAPLAKAIPLPPSPDAAQRSFNSTAGPSYDLIDLGLWDCKFPIGNPGEPDFCFCSARKLNPFKPYCVHHTQIVHQPPMRR